MSSPASPPSGSPAPAASSPTTCSRCDRTDARSSAAGSRCSRRGGRPRLPVRLRLEGLQRDGRVCGRRCRRASSSPSRLPPAIVTPGDEGRLRPRREHRHRGRGGARRRRPLGRGRGRGARALPVRRRARRARGIILADTKFELGLDQAGTLVLGDEALTPDSSASGPPTVRPGGPQPSYDKQYVRDYCESLGWDKTSPGRRCPPTSSRERARYVEAFEVLTGLAFDAYLADPQVVLG